MLRSSLHFLSIFRRACSAATSSHLALMMSEPSHSNHLTKAYIRRLKEQERVEIKLHYVDQDIDLDRWFSFNRQLDDNVQQVKERIVANLDRACLKSHKKKQKSIKKGKPIDPASYKISVDLKKNGEPVDCAVQFRDLLGQDDVSLTINDRVYQFDIDPPTVQLLKLPSAVMAGFSIYPTKLELENCTTSQCEFQWFKSQPSLSSAPEPDSELWIPVGKGVMYGVTNSDIGSWLQLRCIPKDGQGKEGVPEIALTSQAVEAGPGPCPFEVRHNFTKERMNDSG